MKTIPGLSVGVAALALWAAGCQKPAATEGGAAGGGDAALVEKGKTVYAANNCANCHSLNGAGGRGGPELSHIGGEKSADAIAAYVKQPRPDSRMPAFAGKITDDDLKALGTYLATLK